HVAKALLGDRRIRRPHFLPVDDEAVVVHLGASLQAGKVGTRIRFAHADAPDRVAAYRGRHQLVLLGIAELEQTRRDDRITGEVTGSRYSARRHRLEVDERLHRSAVASTE